MKNLVGWRLDAACIAVLTVVWALFFWRLLTPVQADQASLTQGDFSGQFVTFGAYQYQRFTAGEIPLWNPYNNGGLPFIADTQAAVFYPPRLLTIALAYASGTGWTYHALEVEMMGHVLFYTLTFYALIRRLTTGMTGSPAAGVIGALVAGYGGYVTGYPPLQLALLEAGVWFPLTVLGITEATRAKFAPRWLVLTGFALGLSWMAGHPQTSYFLTLLLVAYFAYRVWMGRLGWRVWLIGTALFGLISVGVVAVTLFPGAEYLIQTSRAEFGFEAKDGGFPYRDALQMIFPHAFSLFSPLYIGVTGLGLVVMGVWGRVRGAWFWAGVALFALAFSVGGDGALYHALYNTLPGLRFFRGQERAAFLFANSAAILAAFGAAWLMGDVFPAAKAMLRRGWMIAAAGLFMAAVAAVIAWQVRPDALQTLTDAATFSAIFGVAAALVIPTAVRRPRILWAVAFLVGVELVSANIDRPSNFDPKPPSAQIVKNPLLEPVLADTQAPFRVDGKRVLGANYGSYYGIMDIQGISPLFLTGPQEIIEQGLPDERAWELFSVRYVWSDWEALPVPWEKIAEGADESGAVRLFKLAAQRPFAHLLYDVVTVTTDAEARQYLADPTFDPRTTAILGAQPSVNLPDAAPDTFGTTITSYHPEAVTIIAESPTDAILSIAQVDYPGWKATIDGQPTPILRAYGGLMALNFPAGTHTIELVYDPTSYRVGALVSLVMWGGLSLFGLIMLIQHRRRA